MHLPRFSAPVPVSRRTLSRFLPLCLLGLAALGTTSTARAQNAILTPLHLFAGTDGANPNSTLILAKDGNYYGVTADGGLGGGPGVVYQIASNGTFGVFHDFTTAEGGFPREITQARNLDFYTVTSTTGSNAQTEDINVDQIMPDGTLTLAGGFSYATIGGLSTPIQGIGTDNSLYGVAEAGGANGEGFVYRLVTDGLESLHDFAAGGSDGAGPTAPLVQDREGNFYGTTQGGGAFGNGTVFELSADGTTFTTLHSFDALDANYENNDGAAFNGALIVGSDGNLYGTAQAGGANNMGTVFQVAPGQVPDFTVLHTFSAKDPTAFTNADGGHPDSSLVQGNDGAFYGTAFDSGANRTGTVYRITSDGQYMTLYNFSAFSSARTNTDGANPTGGLIQGNDTFFYGATFNGGPAPTSGTVTQGVGVVYQLRVLPIITSATTEEVTAGTPFSYQITAIAAPTSFAASGLPPGFSFNPITGSITGTPSAGMYPISLSATNPAGTSTATLTLTVDASTTPAVTAPVVTSASAAGQVGVAFSYQIAATNTPTGYATGTLPDGLVLDPVAGIISGTPTVAGLFTVGLSATNAGGTGTGTLTLTISPAATGPTVAAPVISSATSATTQVDRTFSYTITASNTPTGFSAAGLPAGLTFDAAAGGDFRHADGHRHVRHPAHGQQRRGHGPGHALPDRVCAHGDGDEAGHRRGRRGWRARQNSHPAHRRHQRAVDRVLQGQGKRQGERGLQAPHRQRDLSRRDRASQDQDQTHRQHHRRRHAHGQDPGARARRRQLRAGQPLLGQGQNPRQRLAQRSKALALLV